MSWFWLLRPWSYAATLVPFLLGAGLCAGRASLMWANWSVGLLSGLFLQATVNLLNTWGDERSGVDSTPGAFRSTPQVHDGLVSMRGVFAATAIFLFIAIIVARFVLPAFLERIRIVEGSLGLVIIAASFVAAVRRFDLQ